MTVPVGLPVEAPGVGDPVTISVGDPVEAPAVGDPVGESVIIPVGAPVEAPAVGDPVASVAVGEAVLTSLGDIVIVRSVVGAPVGATHSESTVVSLS